MKVKREQFPAMNPNPVINAANDGVILYSNEAGEPLLNEWDVKVGEKLPSYIGKIVQKVISRNSPEKMEVKAGNRIYFVVFSPLPEQELISISGFDISAKEESKERVLESEERLSFIVQSPLFIVTVISVKTGKVLFVNEGFEKAYGYRKEEIVGSKATVLWSNPDEWEEYVKDLRKLRFVKNRESICKRKDGSIFWMAGSFGVVDYDGEEALLAFCTDITERKKAEESLRKSEERLCHISHAGHIGLYEWNADRDISYFSPKAYELYGCDPNSLVTHENWLKRIHPDDRKMVEYTIAKAHDNARNMLDNSARYEFRIVHVDGTVLWLEAESTYYLEGGNLIARGAVRDITEKKRAEEALRESEAQLKEAQRLSKVGNWKWVIDNDIVTWSDELYNIAGLSREKPAPNYKEQQNFYLSESWSLLDNAIRNALETGEPYELILEMVRVDGKYRWIDVHGEVLRDYVGHIVGLRGTVQDITERKQVEEALKKAHETLEEKIKERTAELEKAYNSLKESKERLAEAQKMAHIGNYDNNLVTNELYWSDELYFIFGLDPHEDMTYEKVISYVHPEDREYLNKSNNEALNGNVQTINYRIVRPNGEVRVVRSIREVIFDENNNPVQRKGTLQDITVLIESEEKLRGSEEKYRNIVETANEGIALVNCEGKITYVNKKMADMLGYTEGEIIGAYTWDFVENKSTAIMILENRHSGFTGSLEIKQIRKDGLPLWVHINSKPIFDNNGKFMGSLDMFTDITERKKSEEFLSNIEIARKKEIHHRIKNNLQVISSLLDLQADKIRQKQNITKLEVLNAFKESQDRVISMALIHEELHKGGKLDTLNFSHYVKELVDNLLLTYRLGNEGISLNTDIEEDIFFEMDTAIPLGIIINELLSNSLKYAFPDRENGEIQIKLNRDEGKRAAYILSVSDNGVGIPEDFDIGDSDCLGLQLVTILVNQLDGELELKKNKGTEFTIRFTVKESNNQKLAKHSLQLTDND
jgi:PAS domain S-box-containing protein